MTSSAVGGRPRRGRSVLASVASSGVLGLATMVSGILLLPFVITQFGAAQYGVWLMLSALMIFLFQADLGMGAAVVRFSAISRDAGRGRLARVVSTAVCWNLALSLIAAGVFAVVATIILQSPQTESITSASERTSLIIIGATTLLFLILRPFGNLLQGLGDWTLERALQLVGVGFRIVGTLVVGLTTGDIVHLAVVEAISIVLPSVLAACVVRTRRTRSLRLRAVSREALREQLSYSGRAFAVNAVGSAVLQSGNVIVGLTLGPAAVTYWNAIFRVYAVLRQCVQWIIDPFMPRMSVMFSRNLAEGTRIYYGLTALAMSAVSIVLPALLLMTGTLLSLWLGDQAPVDELTLPLQILLFSVLLNAIHLPAITALNASGHPGVFLPLHLCWFVLTVLIGVLLTPQMGVLGMSLALAVPIVALEPLYVWRAARSLDLPSRAIVGAATKISLPILAISGCVVLLAVVGESTTSQTVWIWVGAVVSIGAGCAVLARALTGGRSGDAEFAIKQRA